jgi:hypothetical protein
MSTSTVFHHVKFVRYNLTKFHISYCPPTEYKHIFHTAGILHSIKTIPLTKTKKTPWPLVRKRTIPTERTPLVGEVSANFCG